MDIYGKIVFFAAVFFFGLYLREKLMLRELVKKMREENRVSGDLFAQINSDWARDKEAIHSMVVGMHSKEKKIQELSAENFSLRNRLGVSGMEGFSSARGDAPFSPREYVSMGIDMITEGKGNVELRRVPTMEQVPDFGQSNNGGQTSAENN